MKFRLQTARTAVFPGPVHACSEIRSLSGSCEGKIWRTSSCQGSNSNLSSSYANARGFSRHPRIRAPIDERLLTRGLEDVFESDAAAEFVLLLPESEQVRQVDERRTLVAQLEAHLADLPRVVAGAVDVLVDGHFLERRGLVPCELR